MVGAFGSEALDRVISKVGCEHKAGPSRVRDGPRRDEPRGVQSRLDVGGHAVLGRRRPACHLHRLALGRSRHRLGARPRTRVVEPRRLEKSNGGQGSLWRSQHELLPVFKKGVAPHFNNGELGRHGRWRSNVRTCLSGKPADERQPSEFATLVEAQLPPQFPRDALMVTRLVFGLLAKELDFGETAKIIATPAGSVARLVARALGPLKPALLKGLTETTMPIDSSQFGAIAVDGKTYEHDVIIRLSGAVEKRRKRLSKEKYGISPSCRRRKPSSSSKTAATC